MDLEECWDDDVDSTKVSLPDKVYSQIYSPREARQSDESTYERGRGGGGGGGRRFGDGGGGGQRDSNNHDSRNNGGNDRGDDVGGVRLQIEYSKKGMVIGRGGAKIREIQEQFSCNVNVDRDCGSDGMCGIHIKGGDADGAKALIEQLVNGGGSGGGGGGGFGGNKRSTTSNSYREPEEFVQIDWQNVAKICDVATKEKWASCPQLIKNFYQEDPAVAAMDEAAVAVFRESHNNIQVSRAFPDQPLADVPIPNPVQTFEQCFAGYADMLDEIRKQGFATPSPIQCQAWPVLLRGEDMIGIAQTGTGKTLAFLLPAMIHTEYQPVPRGPPRGGPNVLVMAPTRELAIQIEREVAKYRFRGMRAVCVYGGADRRAQIAKIQEGVEIVIATPGRLNDLISDSVIDVASITYLVLDEADRMLDMGFEPQIRKFLLNVRPDRQTVMTSATWPPGVRRLAEKYMINPVQVCIGSLDLAAVHSVQQVVEIIDEADKYRRIMRFIKQLGAHEKAIIFCGKKSRADDLSSEVSLQGIPAQCIHGDRDQSDREQALADIKSGEVNILIATDVASRGIDIEDITHVVNYDFPRNIEEYVHRVGRTGRAGRTGVSLSLFTRSDWGSAAELIVILEEADQDVPEELREMKNRFDAMKERREREMEQFGMSGGGGGRGGGRGGGGRGGGGGGYGGGGGRSGGGGYGGGGGGGGYGGGGGFGGGGGGRSRY